MHTETKTLSVKENQTSFISYLLRDGRDGNIDRGYEMIDQKLGELGAHIERVNGIGRGVSRLSLHKQIKRPILRSYLCPGMLRATALNREPEKDALML